MKIVRRADVDVTVTQLEEIDIPYDPGPPTLKLRAALLRLRLREANHFVACHPKPKA